MNFDYFLRDVVCSIEICRYYVDFFQVVSGGLYFKNDRVCRNRNEVITAHNRRVE